MQSENIEGIGHGSLRLCANNQGSSGSLTLPHPLPSAHRPRSCAPMITI
jgi:hypothetical protein